MPSESAAQKRTMAGIAHGWNPDDPDLQKIPVKVAKEYNAADQPASKRLRDAMMKRGKGK